MKDRRKEFTERFCFLLFNSIPHDTWQRVVVLQYIYYQTRLPDIHTQLTDKYEDIRINKKSHEKIGKGQVDSNEDQCRHVYPIYSLTNFELPLIYLDENNLNDYIKTFRCNVSNLSYFYIRPDLPDELVIKSIHDIMKNYDSENTYIVGNYSNSLYDEVLNNFKSKKIEKLFASRNGDGGFKYIIDEKREQNRIALGIVEEEKFDENEINKFKETAINLKIPIPDDNDFYNSIGYYKVAISIKHRKSFLILGDTGTGKSFFVRKVMKTLNRKFSEINCANFTDELFRSEFFGYVKGSHTEAKKDHKGLIKTYDIIFLDEISELSFANQARLLTFLDTGKYFPVGANKAEESSVTLLFASNKDLYIMCIMGEFRFDLYYRIAYQKVTFKPFNLLPKDEKEWYVINSQNKANKENEQVFKEIGEEFQYIPKALTDDTIDYILYGYHWLGNLRELHYAIQKSFIYTDELNINVSEFKKYVEEVEEQKKIRPFNIEYNDIKGHHLNFLVHKFKQGVVKCSVEKNTSKRNAAKELGIKEPTLYKFLKSDKTTSSKD